jgi:hypothetical protein
MPPAHSTWWPRPSATWPTSRCAPSTCWAGSTPWPAKTPASPRTCSATWACTSRCWPCTRTTNTRPAAAVLARLARGESVALSATPARQPSRTLGAVLVAAAAAAGSPRGAAARAQQRTGRAVRCGRRTAGRACQGFVFVGFLPAKGGERREAIHAVLAERRAQVLFEAPHRITLCWRRWPKAHRSADHAVPRTDQAVRDHPHAARTDAPGWLAADANRERGEFVLVLHALPAGAAEEGALPPRPCEPCKCCCANCRSSRPWRWRPN